MNGCVGAYDAFSLDDKYALCTVVARNETKWAGLIPMGKYDYTVTDF